MVAMISVLVVDDDELLGKAICDGLVRRGMTAEVVGSASAARARLERELGVVAGRAGVEQVGGAEVGLVARHRRAVGGPVRARFEITCGIERQQHRNRAASDPGKDLRRDGIQLHQRRRRARIRGRHPPP